MDRTVNEFGVATTPRGQILISQMNLDPIKKEHRENEIFVDHELADLFIK